MSVLWGFPFASLVPRPLFSFCVEAEKLSAPTQKEKKWSGHDTILLLLQMIVCISLRSHNLVIEPCHALLCIMIKAVVTEPKVGAITPELLNLQSHDTYEMDFYGL